MASSWPFTGRAAQLTRIRSASRGMVVAGPPGTGKSRLVAEAVRGLDGVAWARATASGAEIPLGAFAPLLPSTPPAGNPLGWAAAAVQASVLVVDDAHLLDSASAALVHHLVMRGGTRVIATLRSGTPVPDAVFALWKDDLVPRLELQPFSPAETKAVLKGALGGQVESATVDRLWRASQGNALYLRELVLSCTLTDDDGVWRWRGPLTITPSLRETIAGRIGELTAREREALELLAYGEPLGVDLLAALGSLDAVQHLEDRQLVTVQPDGRRLQVRLAHPLHGEVIRDGCGVLRARSMMRRMAGAVAEAGLRRREDVLRVAVWRLDGGMTDDPEPLLAGCERARVVRDLEMAVRLGRAAVAAGGGTRALAVLGTVLFYTDRHDEAEQSFATVWEADMDERARTDLGVQRALNLAIGLGDVARARAVLEETAGLVRETGMRQGVTIMRSVLAAVTGDSATAEDLLAATRRLGPLTAHSERMIGGPEAAVMLARGRPADCLARVEEIRAGLAREPDAMPSLAAAYTVHAANAALLLGDLDTAERHTDEGYGLDGQYGTWTRAILEFGALRSRVLRLRGRLADALSWARDTAARLPVRSVLAGQCLGELAHAYALLGEVAAAEEALARARAEGTPIGPFVVEPLRFAQVWTRAGRGDAAGAVELSLEIADSALPCDVPYALHDVVRLGRPNLVAARLAALDVEGPLVALFARHAAARDGAELDAVTDDFERLGLLLYAAESAAQAAARHREAGLTRGARAAGTRSWRLMERCQGARTLALLDLDVPGLTPRQREIAVLAAQGLTNREIADRLVVSIRTVANTLHAIYDKTGVNDRTALTDLLSPHP
ncbi:MULTISPECIES: LuxR C-terminal-related transcriptional regulator [unclassified Nonomuraea]|uniref:LuxR C-terminal-related transcriptional regulator n=1 Tax=unclassified Nonomuraea TaxID=2593643 RepID=UPI0033EE7915